MKLSPAYVMLVSGLLTACANLAPDYERPVAPVPEEYGQLAPLHDNSVMLESKQSVAQQSPQTFFADEQLQRLLSLAQQNNRDLKVAILNIDQARAQYGVQHAAHLPSLQASSGVSSSRTASDFALPGQPIILREYSVSLGLTAYEFDFFGRISNLKTQAMEQYLATEEAARTVRIGLATEVANTWFTWSADRNRLALSKALLRSQNETLSLMQQKLALGGMSVLEVRQQEVAVANARSDVASLIAQEAKDRNALTLLLGTAVPDELVPQTYSGSFDTRFDEYGRTALPALPAGLPSDLMLRRPDLLEREHALKAASASIGAARAAFYPNISLTAQAGSSSMELDGLFSGGAKTWAFAPQINLPIFAGGANKAKLNIAKAERDIALANYEKAIQTAFREVSDALADRRSIGQQLDAQRDLVKASEDAFVLSRNRFDMGLDDWLDVLNAERTYANARMGLIDIHNRQLSNGVTLYKVLGGGWDSALESTANRS